MHIDDCSDFGTHKKEELICIPEAEKDKTKRLMPLSARLMGSLYEDICWPIFATLTQLKSTAHTLQLLNNR